jgi:hypothetical protein
MDKIVTPVEYGPTGWVRPKYIDVGGSLFVLRDGKYREVPEFSKKKVK